MSELEMATKIAELEKRITLLESGVVQMTPRASMLLKGGKPLLTTAEAAELLGMKKQTVNALVMKGRIPCYKPNGKNTFFDPDELNRWLRRARVTAGNDDSGC